MLPTVRVWTLLETKAARALFVTVLLGVFWGGCEGERTKSQYVGAVVSQECAALSGDERRACRLAVIKRFVDVPLEQMRADYPEPPAPDRPSCSL